MKNQETINKTAEFVRGKMHGEPTGHDWWHVYRVWKTATHIAQSEKCNLFIVELAALLHDIADWKFAGGDEHAAGREARKWLESLEVDEKTILEVCHVCDHISFKGAGTENKIATIEGKIVQDADRLDAMGAIGIARAFAYGGNKSRPIYDPDIKPESHDTFEQYKNSKGHTINHFYEKLLLLKNRMNTATGRQMAEHRHRVMEAYLQEFYVEWEGKV